MNPTFNYQYYETNVGFFFRRHAASYDNNLNKVHSINGILTNEIISMNGWWKITEPIKSVLYSVSSVTKRVGWKVRDPITFDKIPAYFTEDEVKPMWDDDEDDLGSELE